MEMREEFRWATFEMTPLKYVRATEDYNARLETKNASKNRGSVVKKNPRALMEKLTTIEEQVISRIANNNFKCKSLFKFTL